MLDKAGVKDEEVEVKGPTQMHNLLELIKKEQNIYNIVFHELIRQVRHVLRVTCGWCNSDSSLVC